MDHVTVDRRRADRTSLTSPCMMLISKRQRKTSILALSLFSDTFTLHPTSPTAKGYSRHLSPIENPRQLIMLRENIMASLAQIVVGKGVGT